MRSHHPLACLLAAGALVLAACGTDAPADGEQEAPHGVEAAAGDCGPVEQQPDQGHQHLLADAEAPVDYLTTPPTSGWHYREKDRARDALGVHGPDAPLSEAAQVTVLAVNGVVVTHHGLPDADREALETLVADRYDGRAAVSPYEALEPGAVVLTAWRTMQRCDGVDLEAVAGFIDEHAAEEPDFTMDGDADHPH